MAKTRVRKPFMREDSQAHPGLTTEPEEYPAIELPGEEKAFYQGEECRRSEDA